MAAGSPHGLPGWSHLPIPFLPFFSMPVIHPSLQTARPARCYPGCWEVSSGTEAGRLGSGATPASPALAVPLLPAQHRRPGCQGAAPVRWAILSHLLSPPGPCSAWPCRPRGSPAPGPTEAGGQTWGRARPRTWRAPPVVGGWGDPRRAQVSDAGGLATGAGATQCGTSRGLGQRGVRAGEGGLPGEAEGGWPCGGPHCWPLSALEALTEY